MSAFSRPPSTGMITSLKLFTGLPVGADQARFERRGQAQAQLFAIAQAGQVEEILGLHEG